MKQRQNATSPRQARFSVICVLLCVALGVTLFAGAAKEQVSQKYGVFLGLNGDEAQRMTDYDLVVIEPSEFTPAQVQRLHHEGKTLYGYLNVGAIENYRPYYARFENMTLGVYEDWLDEKWADVTSAQWQEFLVRDLAAQYAKLPLDGFFIDNTDVYYNYPEDEVFEGLCAILSGLKGYELPILINGGDMFVSRCIDEGTAARLFDGLVQETVFTSIDFDNDTYGEQIESETDYYQAYLQKAKQAGLDVYLIEYAASDALAQKIDAYCRENGFLWYNARDKELR